MGFFLFQPIGTNVFCYTSILVRASTLFLIFQVDMATLVERQLHSKPSKTKSRTSKLFSGRWSWSSTGKLGQQQQQQQSSEEKRISS